MKVLIFILLLSSFVFAGFHSDSVGIKVKQNVIYKHDFKYFKEKPDIKFAYVISGIGVGYMISRKMYVESVIVTGVLLMVGEYVEKELL